MQPLPMIHLKNKPLQFLLVILVKSRQCLFTIREDRGAEEGEAANDVVGMEGIGCCRKREGSEG